jgi:membrane-bound inhibitor of C-type lysozyme
MNKIAIVVGLVLVLVSAGFFYVFVNLPDEPEPVVYLDESFTFVSCEDVDLTVWYDQSADFARVSFADNEYELERTVSGSGARYESDNGLVVFTEHQGEARLEVDGELTVIAQRTDTSLIENDTAITDEDVTDVDSEERNDIEVVDIPILGQQCVDSETVDCAALEAAASVI